MAQPYLRGNRWYLKYKDARGRWQDKVCSARTKGQAYELLREIQVAEDRARHGLDVRPPEDGGGTVDELIDWWAEKFLKHKVSYGPCIGTIRKHLVGSSLGARRLVDVTPGHVEAFLEERSRDLAAETLNHLRGYLGRAFTMARRAKRFVGPNPVADVPKRKVAHRLPDYLRPEEAVAVLAEMPTKWKCLFATALYTGMRKGELLALRKADVDFSARLITVRRSHDRDTTKGNHQDAIPIAAELVPYLRAAIEASPSELVFPRPDGGMMSRQVQLELIPRRALRRANILTGYRHVCRRPDCGHAELAPNNDLRRCPKCRMKLWPAPQSRPLRFHDIRHTTASLLIMAGADLPAVQRIMRHTDPRITTEFYAHLSPGYLRSAIDRLAINPSAPGEPPTAASAAASAPSAPPRKTRDPREFAAPLLQPIQNGEISARASSEKPPPSGDLQWSGISGSNRRHSAWEASRAA
jgi:integrase